MFIKDRLKCEEQTKEMKLFVIYIMHISQEKRHMYQNCQKISYNLIKREIIVSLNKQLKLVFHKKGIKWKIIIRKAAQYL